MTTGQDVRASIHELLLRDALPTLPEPIRRLHRGQHERRFTGRCRVERGQGLLSRIIGTVMGFPTAQVDTPLNIRIHMSGDADVWLRDFNGAPLRSTLRVDGDMLVERMGPAVFRFRLRVDDAAITWTLDAMKLFGIPVPRALHPRLQARESAEGGRYLFSARAEYPIIGLLVHYYGWLDAGA